VRRSASGISGRSGLLPASKVRPSAARYWGVRVLIVSLLVFGSSFVAGFKFSLAVLTAVGFLMAGAGLFRPVCGLLGVGVLCTIDPFTRGYLMTGGLLRWNTFNYFLILVAIIFLPKLLRLRGLRIRLLQAFSVLLVLQLAGSQDLPAGEYNVLCVVSAMGLLVFFERARGGRDVLEWLGIVSGSIAATAGLVFYVLRDGLPYINPNSWSYCPLTGIFAISLAVVAGRERNARRRFLLIFLLIANLVWVFVSGSRGSLLVAVLCFILVGVRLGGGVQRSVFFAAAGVAVLSAAFALRGYEGSTFRRLETLANSRASLIHRTSGRSDLMLAGWYLFRRNLFGIGTGSFDVAYSRLGYGVGLAGFRRGEQTAAHSAWVRVLAENGAPGFLLFSAWVFSFAAATWRGRGDWVVGALISGSLVLGFVSTEVISKGLWMLAAAGMSALASRGAVRARASSAVPSVTHLRVRTAP
jgi:O-Antigen ligase